MSPEIQVSMHNTSLNYFSGVLLLGEPLPFTTETRSSQVESPQAWEKLSTLEGYYKSIFPSAVNWAGLQTANNLGDISRIAQLLHLAHSEVIIEQRVGYVDGEAEQFISYRQAFQPFAFALRESKGINLVGRNDPKRTPKMPHKYEPSKGIDITESPEGLKGFAEVRLISVKPDNFYHRGEHEFDGDYRTEDGLTHALFQDYFRKAIEKSIPQVEDLKSETVRGVYLSDIVLVNIADTRELGVSMHIDGQVVKAQVSVSDQPNSAREFAMAVNYLV